LGDIPDKAKNITEYVTKITATVTNISTNLKIIEQEFNDTTVTVEERYQEITDQFKEIKIEINQEVTIVAEETCRKDFHAKASPCCPDCKKFRVPPTGECKKAGCEHSCVYQNITCDAQEKPTKPCMFPFTYEGKKYSTCTTKSAFGEVTRPWCYVDSDKTAAFCDCTEIRCICPKGKRLDDDRKTCVSVKETS
jgi:hypothetical protein